MDRFIVIAIIAVPELLGHLKSNMDRFIAIYQKFFLITIKDLKSNMDRFIVQDTQMLSTLNNI